MPGLTSFTIKEIDNFLWLWWRESLALVRHALLGPQTALLRLSESALEKPEQMKSSEGYRGLTATAAAAPTVSAAANCAAISATADCAAISATANCAAISAAANCATSESTAVVAAATIKPASISAPAAAPIAAVKSAVIGIAIAVGVWISVRIIGVRIRVRVRVHCRTAYIHAEAHGGISFRRPDEQQGTRQREDREPESFEYFV